MFSSLASSIEFMVYPLSFIFMILVVVGFHEYGHFITARLLGIKVIRFSIGMGKIVYKKRSKNDIEYVLSMLPVGGYVEMLDTKNLDANHSYSDSDLSRSFDKAPLWKRFLIVFNGPLFNLILAFVIYFSISLSGTTYVKPVVISTVESGWAEKHGIYENDIITSVDSKSIKNWNDFIDAMMASLGSDNVDITLEDRNGKIKTIKADFTGNLISRKTPDPLQALGIRTAGGEASNIIGAISDGSPLIAAGLKKGDKIVDIDGFKTKFFTDIKQYVSINPGRDIELKYEREGVVFTASLTINRENGKGFIGFYPERLEIDPDWIYQSNPGFMGAVSEASYKVKSTILKVYYSIKKLITGDIPVTSLSGPIGVAKISGEVASHSPILFLSLIAFFSINVMILNLLPIPVLDGGHLIQYIIEGLRGKPLSEKSIKVISIIGVVFIALFMVMATTIDVVNLF